MLDSRLNRDGTKARVTARLDVIEIASNPLTREADSDAAEWAVGRVER